ncbi:hypothetical protein [Streptomyces sp. bgisy154]|uniref:hypothetical protein n=1 Tax=Streptomyces sp. bgisy154 TaxID=3413794 RepID=UPI003D704A5A
MSADLTAPLAALDADLHTLAAKRLADGIAAEHRHLLDPLDTVWQQMACDHPEACTCPTPKEQP